MFLKFWMEQHKLLETIIHSNNQGIVYESHKKNVNKIKTILLQDKDLDTLQTEYLLKILTSLMIGVLTVWIDNGKKETYQELLEIIKNAVFVCYQSL